MRKKVPIISLMGLIKSVFLFWIKWYHRRDDSYQRTWCLSRQHSKVDVILPQLRKRPVDGRHLKSSLPGCNPKQMNHTQQVPQLLHVRRASRSSNVYQKKWAALPALSRAWLKSVSVLSKVRVFLELKLMEEPSVFLSSGPHDPQSCMFSMFPSSTWLKWSAHHHVLQWPDKEPFI